MKIEMEKEAGTLVLRSYGHFFKQQYQDYTFILKFDSYEENKSFLPIQIDLIPKERLPIIELITSDNPVMNKILSIFTSLCIEITSLKTEAIER